MEIEYGSVCSGIEAATVAWHGFGWRPAWFAEIEAFPAGVLAHHYPEVRNLGDMTAIADQIRLGLVSAPDVLVGGTPCQAFSVAGLRNSLDDHRGQLSLEFVKLLDEIDNERIRNGKEPAICVWENVPGCLNTKDNAFGCLLGALAGEDGALEPPAFRNGKPGRWANAGIVYGPQRALAWRVFDAQYFGLAQRRKRVFLAASARDGFRPEEILFEPDSLRRNTPPRREAGKGFAAATGEGFKVGGHWDGSGVHPSITQSHNTGGIGASNQEIFSQRGGGLVPGKQWPADCASTLNAHFGDKQGLEDQHALHGAELFVPGTCGVITADISKGPRGTEAVDSDQLVAHSLTRRHDSSEDGTASSMKAGDYKDATDLVSCPMDQGGSVMTVEKGITGTLRREMGGHAPIITCAEVAPCMTSGGAPFERTGNERTECEAIVSIGFQDDTTPKASEERAYCLRRDAGGEGACVMTPQLLVRSLTCEECEALQGFPRFHTRIPWRGKLAENCPDGPRYKALGNSMAVPCMKWIGNRIDAYLEVEALFS